LTDVHRRQLDDLLKRRDNARRGWLAWLRNRPPNRTIVTMVHPVIAGNNFTSFGIFQGFEDAESHW
jgi:hypothetical protein